MINSLWYPPNSSSADVTPWDANGLNTPHAHADYDCNTATSYGLMLAYNQFSSSSVLSGGARGAGWAARARNGCSFSKPTAWPIRPARVAFVNSVTTGTNPTNNSYYNIGGNNASASGNDPIQDAINCGHQNVRPDHATTPTAPVLPRPPSR